MPTPPVQTDRLNHRHWCQKAISLSRTEDLQLLLDSLQELAQLMRAHGQSLEHVQRHPAMQLLSARLAELCDIDLHWPGQAQRRAEALVHPNLASHALPR